jgi:DNA-3-methyladenine glycosylase
LPLAYYRQPTLALARDVLGKLLWRRTVDGVVGGRIVETEAYISAVDPASHNYRKPSPRSMTMFGPPGHAYVYFTYGMYHCLNIVTEPAGQSAAILIRALEPLAGLDLMALRSPKLRLARDYARGPGRLCRALALTIADNGLSLMGDALRLSDAPAVPAAEVGVSPRIGISLGTDLPWRWFVRGNPYVSGSKGMRGE